MGFSDQNWHARFDKMGAEAEDRFLEVAPTLIGTSPSGSAAVTRVGFDKPPFDIRKTSLRVRYMPDFFTKIGWVECQGVGRDQTIKFKREKLAWLDVYAADDPVHIFVWDSHKKRYALKELKEVHRMIDQGKSSLGYFPEPKAYFAVKAAEFFEGES